jgi:arsenate reductase (thioredoxin)
LFGLLSLPSQALPESAATPGAPTARESGDRGLAVAPEREAQTTPSTRIRVLFVCTHNSARSQMAEALLRREGGQQFEVASAGTEATGVNPLAVKALAEVGIDWSGARSKSVIEFLNHRFDYVVTVCDHARETCPVFPGATNSLHWSLDDPAGVEGTEARRLDAFRATRDEIVTRLKPFIESTRRPATPELPTPSPG